MGPLEQTPVDAGAAPGSRTKPVRFKLGIGLLIFYPLMYLVAVIVPFLPLDVGLKAGLIAGDLAAAEVVLLIGVACVGKEAYRAIKARFRGKRAAAALDES
ncbi:transporter suffix domain-containing protein [Nocardia elegans]|uniref:transporter suffix domain-containing protein n=1 Tax=Nocardia elegans TaxID=300029 RepID=UPI001895350A|nr:transporter suffix domain-containing protein [Nocardia elegans]MBF6245672.1 transporter suffix domain-containing protein [Nocardia elegans]